MMEDIGEKTFTNMQIQARRDVGKKYVGGIVCNILYVGESVCICYFTNKHKFLSSPTYSFINIQKILTNILFSSTYFTNVTKA